MNTKARPEKRLIALLLALMVGVAFTMADVQPAYAAGKPGAVKKVTVKTTKSKGSSKTKSTVTTKKPAKKTTKKTVKK